MSNACCKGPQLAGGLANPHSVVLFRAWDHLGDFMEPPEKTGSSPHMESMHHGFAWIIMIHHMDHHDLSSKVIPILK
jgi:hypothetical protein